MVVVKGFPLRDLFTQIPIACVVEQLIKPEIIGEMRALYLTVEMRACGFDG